MRWYKIIGLLVALVLTQEEVSMIARVAYNEANNQSELGKRLVIDCILNRVEDERFPATVAEVIGQPNQFTKGVEVESEELNMLVEQEAACRTNDKVLWFRTKRYHKYGAPILREGRHYFSGGGR